MATVSMQSRWGGSCETDTVVNLVNKYGSDTSFDSGGKLEMLETEIENTRVILARLIDKVADKRIFTDEELVEIIRGY